MGGAFLFSVATMSKYEELLQDLKGLLVETGVNPNEVTLASSATMGALGIRDVHDLDVQVSRQAFEKLSRHPRAKVSVSKLGSPLAEIKTKRGEIQFFTGRWSIGGKDFSKAPTERYNDIKHWSLPTVIEFKKRMGREKDMKDIDLIKEHQKSAFIVGFFDEFDKIAMRGLGGGLSTFRRHPASIGGRRFARSTGTSRVGPPVAQAPAYVQATRPPEQTSPRSTITI